MIWERSKYDDFGWPKEFNIPPITHEELQRWKRKDPWRRLEPANVSRLLNDLIITEEEMNGLVIIDGANGSGKSRIWLNICWNGSILTADELTGDPANWRKFFPYQETVQVIEPTGMIDLARDKRKHLWKFWDDAFKWLNRKDWQSEIHRVMGEITATDRVFRNITGISVQQPNSISAFSRN